MTGLVVTEVNGVEMKVGVLQRKPVEGVSNTMVPGALDGPKVAKVMV
jgi:hypothetical protein